MPIVIVDDSPTNLAVLKSLSMKSHVGEAKGFSNPGQAMAFLKANPARLIVIDYSMPGLNGIDFIREIRASTLNQGTPVVMVTHSADHAVRKAALKAGATDFVTKPVDAVQFKARIKDLLEGEGRPAPVSPG